MFLDTAATFPTIAGVPIKLAVNGTTTDGLGIESKIDIPALMFPPYPSSALTPSALWTRLPCSL